jgi:hypothetical protein
MSTEKHCYITFPGLTHLLMAEKHLAKIGENFLIVPIPREISSDCGMCIMIEPKQSDKIVEILAQAGITYNSANVLTRQKTGFLKNLFKKK